MSATGALAGRKGWPQLLASPRPIVLAGTVLSVALFTPLGTPEQRLAASLVVVAAVGWLATRLALAGKLNAEGWDSPERLALAAAFAVIAPAIVAGAVFAITRRLDPIWLGAGMTALLLLLARCNSGIVSPPWKLNRTDATFIVILLALAGPLRLVSLGFSEYQGDEASVLHRAAALSQGVEQAWLAHRKGPGEILMTGFFGQVVGRVAESDARFPFALASVLGVVALYALGRAMFDARAGFIAAALWALNGYSVGMGRIVQYHSVVVLLTTVAALCAWRAYCSPERRKLMLGLAFGFLCAGAGFGFNLFTFGIPAAVFIVAALIRHRPKFGLRAATALVLVFWAVTIPLTVHAVWQRDTLQAYLTWRVGRGQPFNNLDVFGGLTMVYTGLPYLVVTVGLFVLGVCIVGTRWIRSDWQRGAAIGAVAGVVLALTILSAFLRMGPTWLAVLGWASLVVLTLAAARAGLPWLSLGLGALLPFGLYGFLLERANTHWLEAFPAALLLAGAAVSEGMARLPSGTRRLAGAVGAVTLIVVGVYPVYHFLPTWDPSAQPPMLSVYRPSGRTPRQSGGFGLPHQDGWKALAVLEAQGMLPLPYTSNETEEVTRWYLPTAERCVERSRSYILARAAFRPQPTPAGSVSWRMRVNGRERAVVLDRSEFPRPSTRVTAEPSAEWFDRYLARLDRPLGAPQVVCPRPMPPAWLRN